MPDSPQALQILLPESSRLQSGVVLVPQLAQLSALTAARLRECGCLGFCVEEDADGMAILLLLPAPLLAGEAFVPSWEEGVGPVALSGDPGTSVSAIPRRADNTLL